VASIGRQVDHSAIAADHPTPQSTFPVELDQESRSWLDRLGSAGPQHVDAVEALFELLHRGARHETNRRRGSLPPAVVSELDDLARQAADDALEAVLRKLGDYRGASRFTTWAWKFVIFEVSAALRRAAWRGRSIAIDDAAWDRLADAAPFDPHAAVETRDLLAALQRSVGGDLTPLQREVFVAIVVLEVPVDVVAERRGTTRGAIYKVLHDARRNLRLGLARQGWVDDIGGAS
jgi:RNA polymerase sigma-70 factor (ECF subfamily)